MEQKSSKSTDLKQSIFDIAKELATIVNEIDEKKAKKIQNQQKD